MTALRCQGWQYNLGAYFVEGQCRVADCSDKPEFRVFINPPKDGDDGTRLACRICSDFTWGMFRREVLESIAQPTPSEPLSEQS